MIVSTGRGELPKPTRLIRVEVLYPPNVKNLTVDGRDNVIIDEGQVVNVSCLFEKGNPPGVFYLLDKHGDNLNASSSEGQLSYSLTARCEDDWPVVRCEGNGSQHNMSVTILVKCRPQFVDKSTKTVDPGVDTVKFGVKAHTTAVNRCLLTSLTLQHNNTKEVNCILTGDPPDLVLSLQLERDDSFHGNWTLTLSNDWGSSNTTVIVSDKSTLEQSPALTSEKTINIILVCGIVAAVVLITVAGSLAIKKVTEKRYGSVETNRHTVGNDRSNENRRGSCSSMIVNDVYETSGAVNNNNHAIHTSSPHTRDPLSPLTMSEMPARPPRSQHAQTRVTAADVHNISRNASLGAEENTYVSAPEVREKKRLKKQVGADDSQGDTYVSARDVRKEKKRAKKECKAPLAKVSDEAQTTMSVEKPSGSRNADGLIYGDLDFTTTSSPKDIIGSTTKTEYADIKDTAIVPPPRSYQQKINRPKKE
ncbi:uncharacterized protein LOC112569090 isoform X2 [Pomacea canaliculata]|nr:uncharacterized protein LOC112569090 isoform X2 [Pomacea canaliculata]XP_025102548.1 uncharacterized protein LOC112569090 isoform X2 [Pomacea canaliculata]XP_025102549.1 uncharacterized protein LOC112569090 isoform X2 [Pomacea canaliculata]